MCPLLLWLHTKHFHTALKYLPFLKSCHPTLRIYNPVLLGSVLKTEKKAECGGSSFLFSQYATVPDIFYQPLFPVLQCFISFNAREGHFISQMMSAQGQTSSRFLDLVSCVYQNSQVFCDAVGAESSFRPWSLCTGSVALIAQVIDQIKESTVMPPLRCR